MGPAANMIAGSGHGRTVEAKPPRHRILPHINQLLDASTQQAIEKVIVAQSLVASRVDCRLRLWNGRLPLRSRLAASGIPRIARIDIADQRIGAFATVRPPNSIATALEFSRHRIGGFVCANWFQLIAMSSPVRVRD
jgi:hypothetical protein